MTRKALIVFCGNDHGSGDATFPDVSSMDGYAVRELFIEGSSAAAQRRAAKKAGWGRVNGEDYCPFCMESMCP